MATGFDVSALTAYVDENLKELMTTMVAGASDFETGHFRIETGIKAGSSRRLHFFEPTLEWQQGNCVSTPSGGTAFTEKTLTVEGFSHFDQMCYDDFYSKWYSQFLRNGALAGSEGDSSLEGAMIEKMASIAANQVAVAAWQGGWSGAGTTNDISNQVDGILKKLNAAPYVTQVVKLTSVGAFTSSNAIAIIDGMVATATTALAGVQQTISMGYAPYNALKVALRNAQAIAFNFNIEDQKEFRMPGYDNIIIRRSDGLLNANAIVMTHDGNFIMGTDLVDDKRNFKFGYNDEYDRVWNRCKLSLGFEIAFPSQVTMYQW